MGFQGIGSVLRARYWFQALWLCLVLPAMATEAQDRAVRAVDDLRYGVALYEYFQRNYLTALSELEVAQALGQQTTTRDSRLLLQGAMNLAFGLEQKAIRIFEQASIGSADPAVRDAAWFYLARQQYRRGEWLKARSSLKRVSSELPAELNDEVQAIRVNLAIMTRDLPGAEVALRDAAANSGWIPYLYYNLGTAHIRQARSVTGIKFLDGLANQKMAIAEHLAIQDKGLTAAGFSLMQSQDYDAALKRFSKVRLSSPVVEPALLGYGWSAAQMGDYRVALGPWRLLAGRAPLRPEVQEALLAVPYAEEKLGYLARALDALETAERTFSRELARLEELKQQASLQSLAVSMRDKALDDSEESVLDARWQGIIELLSSDEIAAFSEAFNDLDLLADSLASWQHKVEIYQQLLALRKQRRAAQQQRFTVSDYPARMDGLKGERNRLQTELSTATDMALVHHYGEPDLQAQWSRVESAETALQRLQAAGQSFPLEAERLARFRGILQWRISANATDWRWKTRKRLAQLDAELTDLEENIARIQRLIALTPDITPYERRLAALAERTRLQQHVIGVGQETLEVAFQAAVVSQIERQQVRLANYLSQAQLSRARLYDQARQEARR